MPDVLTLSKLNSTNFQTFMAYSEPVFEELKFISSEFWPENSTWKAWKYTAIPNNLHQFSIYSGWYMSWNFMENENVMGSMRCPGNPAIFWEIVMENAFSWWSHRMSLLRFRKNFYRYSIYHINHLTVSRFRYHVAWLWLTLYLFDKTPIVNWYQITFIFEKLL